MPNKDKAMAYMVNPNLLPNTQTQAFSFDPPMQANMMGAAQPVFSPQAMGMAQTAFGTPAARQASVGSAFPVSKAQMEAFGPGKEYENPGLLEAIKKADKSGKAADNSPNSYVVPPVVKKMTKTVEKMPVKQDPDVFTKTYNAATGKTIDEDPFYNYKKRNQYAANAIEKYGSLENARNAYKN